MGSEMCIRDRINTFIISFADILFGFPLPIIFALLLNEPFKKAWPLMLAVSILAPVVLYAIFGMFLKVPLPNGILSGLLG